MFYCNGGWRGGGWGWEVEKGWGGMGGGGGGGGGGRRGGGHQTHSVKLMYSCKIIFKTHQVFVENLQYIYIVVLLDRNKGL